MNKYSLLGLINVAFLVWFIVIIAGSNYHVSYPSFYSAVKGYSSLIIIFFLALISVRNTYILLYKQPKKISWSLMSLLTFISLFWFIFSFIGFFFARSVFFPLSSLLIAGAFYFYIRQKSRNVALFLALGTMSIMVLVIFSSFEESYCYNQGMRADPTGAKFMQASKEDAIKLTGYKIVKGQEIGTAFRAHMLCHQSFSFPQALFKAYTLR